MIDSAKLLNAANAYNSAASNKIGNMIGGGGIAPAAGPASETAFSSLLSESVQSATTTLKAGETAVVKGLLNESSLADLATAVTDAELTLRTVVTVRDRIISAYQDIIKMPI